MLLLAKNECERENISQGLQLFAKIIAKEILKEKLAKRHFYDQELKMPIKHMMQMSME